MPKCSPRSELRTEMQAHGDNRTSQQGSSQGREAFLGDLAVYLQR
jgi:hypothetical protein